MRLRGVPGSDFSRQHQHQQDEGRQQGQGEQQEARVEAVAALDALPLGGQPCLPQGGDHGLVEEQDQGHVQPALYQVEGEEHGGQHGGDGFPGDAHVEGGDQVVPEDHDHRQHHGAQGQAQDRALPGAHFLVDKGGGAAEGAGGQYVHDKADGAGVADSEHLHQGHHNGDDGGGEGPEEEAADADHGVLHIHLEEAGDLGQHLAEEHGHIG